MGKVYCCLCGEAFEEEDGPVEGILYECKACFNKEETKWRKKGKDDDD